MDVVAIQMLYIRAMEHLRTLRDDEEGQGLVEYALILSLVVVGAIAFLTAIGTGVENTLQSAAEGLGAVFGA